MRQFKYILAIFAAAVMVIACSDDTQSEEPSDKVELRGITAITNPDFEIGMSSTRAPSPLVLTDPSATLLDYRGTNGWMLDVKIYKGASAYTYGINTYLYSTGTSWIPQTGQTTYFPNYFNQTGEFTLYPSSPTASVALDQTLAADMLTQDILYVSKTVTPAHIISVQLKHKQSMLDFTFDKMPYTIQSVKVEIGATPTVYTPYNVPTTSHYLLIVPSGTTANPTVVVTTTDGAVYRQVVKIVGNTSIGNPQSLAVNNRYIFTLIGLELGLSPVSVVDWIKGGMVGGDYDAITAYPTFRAPAFSTCDLTYDTGLIQTLVFNSQGECTVKPMGRTIVKVVINGVTYNTTIVLGSMIVDLNPIIT